MTILIPGQYGASKIDLDALTNDFVDVSHNLKVKKWSKNGTRLYLRVRREDDKRRFDEFYIDIPEEAP